MKRNQGRQACLRTDYDKSLYKYLELHQTNIGIKMTIASNIDRNV